MSDEKRREELKAKINEQLDKLSIEELESVAGGENRARIRCCKSCGLYIPTSAINPFGDTICPWCGSKN